MPQLLWEFKISLKNETLEHILHKDKDDLKVSEHEGNPNLHALSFRSAPPALTRHKMADTARPSQSPTSEASFLTGMACVDIHVLGHDNSDEYPASPSSRKTSNQMAQAEQDRTK